MKDEMVVLACAPADMPFVVPGSDFTHVCADCGERVMIAPSGQRLLKRQARVKIVCVSCIVKTELPPDAKVGLPMSVALTLEEASRVVPNLWKMRN